MVELACEGDMRSIIRYHLGMAAWMLTGNGRW
jgi:hypothetical protein